MQTKTLIIYYDVSHDFQAFLAIMQLIRGKTIVALPGNTEIM